MEEITIPPHSDDAINRTVLVTNISPQATNKTVSDFFAFCGTISSLTMRIQPNSAEKVQEAIIEFSQEAATKTALLLTNALIIDRPINVARYTGEFPKTEEEQKAQNVRQYKDSEIENKPHEVPAGQRSQTSVIASLIAAGYELASGTLETAKAYDEKYAVTGSIRASADTVVNAVKAKTSEIDAQYHISETTSAWYKAASDRVAEVDTRYGVSASANAVAQSADKIIKDVSESAPVQATSQALKSTSDVIVNYADHVGKEVQKIIDEKPSLKAASDSISGTAHRMSGEYNAVVEETSRLIKENQESKEEIVVEGESSGTTTTTSSVAPPEVNPSGIVEEKKD